MVDEVGPESPLGCAVGDRVATLVSLTLTPLQITDELAGWDGKGEQVPAQGHAILFGRSIAAKLPDDLKPELSLAVMDVCGAPALTARVVAPVCRRGTKPVVCSNRRRREIGLAVAGRRSRRRSRAARSGRAGPAGARPARPTPGSPTSSPSPTPATRSRWRRRWRTPGARRTSPSCASTYRAASTAPILSTAAGGTVIFFSMATSFSRRGARRGGPGRRRHDAGRQRLRARATRTTRSSCCAAEPGVRGLFESRLAED